jgi:hypothetical protein
MKNSPMKIDLPDDEIGELIAQVLTQQMKAIVNRRAMFHARKVVLENNIVELLRENGEETTIKINYKFDITTTAILAALALVLPAPKGEA